MKTQVRPVVERELAETCKPAISLFFPVYNDVHTIRPMTLRALDVLDDIASDYEIVIVNDGSSDDSGAIADALAREFAAVRVVHHQRNRGYGAAIQTGLKEATRYPWVCFTDGDNQYDVGELLHMTRLLDRYDLIIGFRLRKIYGPLRIAMSATMNWVVRRLFGYRFRDLTCGLKLARREVLDDIRVTCGSPFVGGEIVLRAAVRGYRIGEVGISTYPRKHGDSAVISLPNIVATVKDVLRLRREIFHNDSI